MLLSTAPKISVLCSNYAQSYPIMPLTCKYNFTVEYSIKVYINECSIGVFYLCGDCSIRVYQSFLIAGCETGLLL